MTELKLDLLQTLTLGALVYFAGIQLRKRTRWLDRLNIPSAVVGGLLFTALVLAFREADISVVLNTSLQQFLSVAFFTSIGMGASLALLKAGGLQVVTFLLFATVFCFVLNFLPSACTSSP
jgi:glutamate:Na+ symporter, ESS family